MQRREFLKNLLAVALGTSTAKLLGFTGKKVADEPIIFEAIHNGWTFIVGRVSATERDYTMWCWCRVVIDKVIIKEQVTIAASKITGVRGIDRRLTEAECKAIFESEKKRYG